MLLDFLRVDERNNYPGTADVDFFQCVFRKKFLCCSGSNYFTLLLFFAQNGAKFVIEL